MKKQNSIESNGGLGHRGRFVRFVSYKIYGLKKTRASKWVNSWRPGLGSFLVGGCMIDGKLLNGSQPCCRNHR